MLKARNGIVMTTANTPATSPKKPATAPGLCPKCGYDLRSTAACAPGNWTCPECGVKSPLADFAQPTLTPRERVGTFAGLVAANAGVLLIIAAFRWDLLWPASLMTVICLLEAILWIRPMRPDLEPRVAWLRTVGLGVGLAFATGLVMAAVFAAFSGLGVFFQ